MGRTFRPHLIVFDLFLLQGNAIYNLLPDIISRLSDPEGGVEEEPFHTIMKYGFLHKLTGMWCGNGVCVCSTDLVRNQTCFLSQLWLVGWLAMVG